MSYDAAILVHMKTYAGKLLWIDLEMTGLDPLEDRILEVGAIVTDWEFNEIAVLEAVKKVEAHIMNERMVGEFWESFPQVRSALIAQNEAGQATNAVEDALLELIAEHFDPNERVLLAGNSIHQDRKFIANEWRRFDERLHYRMLDVSAWKAVFEGKYRKKFAKPQEHRALADIRGSIEELKYYLQKVST